MSGFVLAQTAALPIPAVKSGEEKGCENGTGAHPFFSFKSGPAKNVEKRVTPLKVVWILRIPFATGSNEPKTGKG